MRVETSTVQQVQQLAIDLHNQHQDSMKGSCTCCTDPPAPEIQSPEVADDVPPAG